MIKPTVEQLRATLEKLGHKVFTQGAYNLNLVGIRKDWTAANRFDDTFICFYRNEGGAWLIKYWPCTTDPGWFHLENGLAKGTAILKEGQYRGAYHLGLHRGGYEALTQVGPVTVYRDADGDHKLDRAQTETGLFGINIHRANAKQASLQVDKWSAGCQVLADPGHFLELMTLAKLAARRGAATGRPGSFTYTLITEADLEPGS